MSRPNSRQSFIDFCLRRLGAPVIDINMDEEQVEDRVDEALQFYQTYHYDAQENLFIVYEITDEDVTKGYITMPDDITAVTRMIDASGGIGGGGFGNNIWHGMKRLAHDIGFGIGACGGGLTNYNLMMNYVNDLRQSFQVNHSTEFQRRNHRLYLLSKVNSGTRVILEVFRIIDPEKNPDVWNDRWLQKYATALIGRNFGENLAKYSSIELPSGITLDGNSLYDRYNEIVERMEEEIIDRWEEPLMMRIG